MKHLILFVSIALLSFQGRASQLLIPMDETQSNHLKAYGVAFYVLEQEVIIDWLLNYRGGSFLMPHLKVFVGQQPLNEVLGSWRKHRHELSLWPLQARRTPIRPAVATGSLLNTATLYAATQDKVQWHDVREWGLEGKGFDDTDKYFDRLPARAKGVVRDAVWNLSRHSAGMMVQFRTDATEIHTDHTVTSAKLAMARTCTA